MRIFAVVGSENMAQADHRQFTGQRNCSCRSAEIAGSLPAGEILVSTARFRNPAVRTLSSTLCCPAVVVAACLFCSGCLNPNYARLPQCLAAQPSQESRAWEHHYPFSEPDLGPASESVPRGFDRPRSGPRRAAEQRVFQGLAAGPESQPAGPEARNYSRSVN